MPPSKKKVIEKLSEVKNLGTSYATAAYEDLGVRNLDDLIKAANDGELQTIKGIGAAKEKKILASARDLQAESKPAPAPEKKSKKSGSKSKKSGSKSKKNGKAKPPKAESKKPEPKKEEPKAKARSERPRTTYRPPQPKPRPSIPGLIFKLTKKIIGRILS